MLRNVIKNPCRKSTFISKPSVTDFQNDADIITQNKIENFKQKLKLIKMISFDLSKGGESDRNSNKFVRSSSSAIKNFKVNPRFSFKSQNYDFFSIINLFYPAKNEQSLTSPTITKKRTRRKSLFQKKNYQLPKERVPTIRKSKSQIISIKLLQKFKRTKTRYFSVKEFNNSIRKSNTKLNLKFRLISKNILTRNIFVIENEILIEKYGMQKLRILNDTLDNFIRDNFLNIKQNNQTNISKSNIRDYKDYKFVVELSQIDFSVDDFLDVIITIISYKNENSLCEIKILENFLFLMYDIYNVLMKLEKKIMHEQIYNLAFNLDYKNIPKDYIVYRYGDKGKNVFLLIRGIVDSFIPQQQNVFITFRNYEYYLGCLLMYNEFNLFSLVIEENYKILPVIILDDLNLFGLIIENGKDENMELLLKKIVDENKKIKALHALKNFNQNNYINPEELLSELHINRNEKVVRISELLSVVIEEEFKKEQQLKYQTKLKKISNNNLSNDLKSENSESEKSEENENDEIEDQKNENNNKSKTTDKKNIKGNRKLSNLSYTSRENNLQLLTDCIIDRKDYRTNKDIDSVSSEEYISRINESIIQNIPQKPKTNLPPGRSFKLPITIPKLTVYSYSKVSTIDIGSLLGQEALSDANGVRQATIITKNNFCDFGIISKKVYEQSLKFSLEKIKIETINNILSLKLFEGCRYGILKHKNMRNFSVIKYVKGEILNINNDNDNINNNENIYIITEGEFSFKAKLSLKDMNYLIRLYMEKYDNKTQFLNSSFYREFTMKNEMDNIYQYYGEKKVNEMLNRKRDVYLYNISSEEIIGLTYDQNDNLKMISKFFEYECLSQRATVTIIPKITLNQIKNKFSVLKINEYKLLQRYYHKMAKTLIGKRNEFLNEYQYLNGNDKYDFLPYDSSYLREKYKKNKLKNSSVKVEMNSSYYNYKQLNEILNESKNKLEEKKLLNFPQKKKYNKNNKAINCMNLYNYYIQRNKEEKKKNNNSLSFGKVQYALNTDKNFRDLLKDNLIFVDNEENENKNSKFSTVKNYNSNYSSKKEIDKINENIENPNEDLLNDEKSNKEIIESEIIKSNETNQNSKEIKAYKSPLIYRPIETQLNDSQAKNIKNSLKRAKSLKDRKFLVNFNNFAIKPKIFIKTMDNYEFDEEVNLYSEKKNLNNQNNILFFEHKNKNDIGGIYDGKLLSKYGNNLKYYNDINDKKYIDVNISKKKLAKQGLMQKLNVFKVFMESAAMLKKGNNEKEFVSLNDMIWQKLTGNNDNYPVDKKDNSYYNLTYNNNNTYSDFNWTDYIDNDQLNKILNENRILNKLSFANNESEKSIKLSKIVNNIKNKHKIKNLRSLQIRFVNERNKKNLLKTKSIKKKK